MLIPNRLKTELIHQPDGTLVVRHTQHVKRTLEHAEMLRQTSRNGWSIGRETQHLAHMPAILIWRCKREHPEWFEEEPSQSGYLVKNNSAFEHWLKTDPVASHFLVAEDKPVQSGQGLQVIIK